MSATANQELELDHPSYMTVLGLLPPYELEDIKVAYREKAKVAHPDHGGDPAEFMRLKEAYDQAVEYYEYRGSRRAWIAAQVDQNVRQDEVIAEVLRRGGRIEIERLDWIEKSWGEGFSYLADRLRHIYVRDMLDGDNFIKFLSGKKLAYLAGLDVSGSRASNESLLLLADFEVLRWLDVSGTGIKRRTLQTIVNKLPSLEWLNVRNTRLGWLGRLILRHPTTCKVVTEVSPAIAPGSATIEFQDLKWHD
jgi:hypothetical protein